MSELIVKKLSVSNKLPLKSFNAGSEYVLIPGPQGEPGPEGASAYDVAVANGFKGSETEWLATLKGEKGADGKIGVDGAPGKSVYDIWLEQGNIGTEEDFLNSLKGEKGADGTMFFEDLTEEQKESLKGEPGATGPIGPEGPQGPQGEKGEKGADGTMIFEDLSEEQKESLKGADGKSAYQIWIDAGNEGSEEDFLSSLKGESGQNGASAYDAWLAAGNQGTEEDFFNSLKGEKGADGTMTFEDLTDEQKESLKGDPGEKGESGEKGDPGEPGANGKSAYDIWLDAGNTGSEEEFLKALKGEKGDEGQPGQDGNKGDDGFSPVVTVTPTTDGHNVAIEDANGVQNFEVLNGKDADISRSEVLKTYTSLYNLNTKKGLSLEWENNVDNTQKIIDALEGREEFMDSFSSSTNRIGIVGNYGTTINNFHIIKRSADLAIITATTNAGTILNRTYTNGTLSDWYVNIAVYTSLSELGLTADATFQDVIDKLPKGGSALLGVKEFTNYQTIFPYEEGSDQFARVHIVKGVADGSCVYARWFRKDGSKEAIAKFNINTNKFDGWQMSANKQEIIDEVLAAIPSSEEVEY